MSAQNSPLLSSLDESIKTNDSQSSFVTKNQLKKTDTQDRVESNILEDETLSPLIEEEIPWSIETTKQAETNTTENHESQLSEVEQLQQQMLANEDFDFSTLEAPGAGIESPAPLIQTEKSFSNPAFVEHIEQTGRHSSNTALNPIALESIADSEPQNTKPLDSYQEELKQTKRSELNLNEDLIIQRSGQFNSPEPFESSNIDSDYGTLSISEDGSWTYILNNTSAQIQELNSNDQLSEIVSITTNSGNTFEFEITIQGSNDRPIITGDKVSEVHALSNYEHGERPETVSGKLDIADKDLNQSNFIENDELDANFGVARIDSEGNWVYELDSEQEAIKNLKQGESLEDLLIVHSIDGTPQTINITIFGSDDKPILSGQNKETLDLSHQTSIEETLTINDPDFGESYFKAETNIISEKGYGVGSISNNGEWSFQLLSDHPTIQTLNQGAKLFDFFKVSTADGTEQSIIIKIQNGEAISTKRQAPNLGEALEETSEEQEALDNFLAQDSGVITTTPSQETFNDTPIENTTLNNLLDGTASNIDTI